MRLFIAVNLQPTARKAIARIMGNPAERNGVLRIVPSQNLHITLQFLGELALDEANLLTPVLQRAASDLAPFEIDFRGMGAFPSRRRPRIIWVGVGEGASPLMELAARVRQSMKTLGDKGEKPFTPHVTVARVRRGRKFKPGDNFWQRSFEEARSLVESVALMKSEFLPAGAHYQELHAFPLGGPAEG